MGRLLTTIEHYAVIHGWCPFCQHAGLDIEFIDRDGHGADSYVWRCKTCRIRFEPLRFNDMRGELKIMDETCTECGYLLRYYVGIETPNGGKVLARVRVCRNCQQLHVEIGTVKMDAYAHILARPHIPDQIHEDWLQNY